MHTQPLQELYASTTDMQAAIELNRLTPLLSS